MIYLGQIPTKLAIKHYVFIDISYSDEIILS